jgi:hypothetical protein
MDGTLWPAADWSASSPTFGSEETGGGPITPNGMQPNGGQQRQRSRQRQASQAVHPVFGPCDGQLGSTGVAPPVFAMCGLSCKTMFNKEV